MDDIIFEKDYRETESAEYDKWCDEVFDRAVNCGMLKAYSEAMDKIPKIIVPEDKKNYEYLLISHLEVIQSVCQATPRVYQGNRGLSSLARGNQYVSSVCGVR